MSLGVPRVPTAKPFLQLPFLQVTSSQTPRRLGKSGSPPKTLFLSDQGLQSLVPETSTPNEPLPGTQQRMAGWGCPLVTRQFLGWKMLNQKWGAHKSVNLLMLHPQKRKKADWLHPLTTHAGCRGHVALTWQPFPPPAAPPHRGLGSSLATPWLPSPPCSAVSLPQRPREAFGEGERAVWIGGKPQPP